MSSLLELCRDASSHQSPPCPKLSLVSGGPNIKRVKRKWFRKPQGVTTDCHKGIDQRNSTELWKRRVWRATCSENRIHTRERHWAKVKELYWERNRENSKRHKTDESEPTSVFIESIVDGVYIMHIYAYRKQTSLNGIHGGIGECSSLDLGKRGSQNPDWNINNV